MSRRTLILIVVLIGITAVLLAIALTPKQVPAPVGQKPTPSISYAQTILRISNNPTAVNSTSSATPTYSTEVTITTGNNMVNAVQLELAFDPAHLYNVDIKPSQLFQNATELIKKNRWGERYYFLCSCCAAWSKRAFREGCCRCNNFSGKRKSGELTRINFLPKSLVTAQGIDKSVLKTAVGATFPNRRNLAFISLTEYRKPVRSAGLFPVVSLFPINILKKGSV